MIPELGRSPGGGKAYPLQYSDLENSMDCMVHGVTKSRTQLSDFHFHIPKQQSLVQRLLFLSSWAVTLSPGEGVCYVFSLPKNLRTVSRDGKLDA